MAAERHRDACEDYSRLENAARRYEALADDYAVLKERAEASGSAFADRAGERIAELRGVAREIWGHARTVLDNNRHARAYAAESAEQNMRL